MRSIFNGVLGVIVFAIGLIALALTNIFAFLVTSAAQGFVLMILWNWFVAPLGVIELSWFAALGLMLAVNFITNKGIMQFAKMDRDINKLFDGKSKKKPIREQDIDPDEIIRRLEQKKKERLKNLRNSGIKLLISSVIIPAMVLFLGWIIHLFIA